MIANAWTAELFARSVLTTAQWTLITNRSRWAQLMPTEKLNEQWWRDELYLTLNNWCYSLDIPPTAAVIQQNPNSYGIECAKCFVDIMVGSWDCENLNVRRDAPRVWMELKVRPTFWPPRKALYENDCTESDIRKLKRIP